MPLTAMAYGGLELLYVRQFPGAFDQRMARENLLGQRRTRSRHADDEDRSLARIAEPVFFHEEERRECRDEFVDLIAKFLEAEFPRLYLIRMNEVPESLFRLFALIVDLPKRAVQRGSCLPRKRSLLEREFEPLQIAVFVAGLPRRCEAGNCRYVPGVLSQYSAE